VNIPVFGGFTLAYSFFTAKDEEFPPVPLNLVEIFKKLVKSLDFGGDLAFGEPFLVFLVASILY